MQYRRMRKSLCDKGIQCFSTFPNQLTATRNSILYACLTYNPFRTNRHNLSIKYVQIN